MARLAQQFRLVRPGKALAAVVLFAVLPFALRAQTKGAHPKRKDYYKHQIEKLEEDWRTAQLNGDTDAMDKLLSDDYVGITMAGQVVTKMQQLDRMRNRSTVLSKFEFSDVKIKMIGTTAAIVTCLADVDGTNDGEPMHGTFRSTRVYSRPPSGAWKITNFEATRVGPPPPTRERRHQPDDASPSQRQ